MPSPRALRPAAVPDNRYAAGGSAFPVAVAEIAAGVEASAAIWSQVSFDSEPPPRRLAPEATAIAATVELSGDEIGAGRFVLLYDPAGQEGWAGPFRVIAYIRAELEPEIAADPLIGQVGWSWLTEALMARQAGYAAPSGSVTRVVTEGFGTKADQPVSTEFEMRASWSPTPEAGGSGGSPSGWQGGGSSPLSYALDRHVVAWADALCVACGLPPPTPGVAQLPPAQLRAPQLRTLHQGQTRPRHRP